MLLVVRSARSLGGRLGLGSSSDVDRLASRSYARTYIWTTEQLEVPVNLDPAPCNTGFRQCSNASGFKVRSFQQCLPGVNEMYHNTCLSSVDECTAFRAEHRHGVDNGRKPLIAATVLLPVLIPTVCILSGMGTLRSLLERHGSRTM